MRMTHKGKKISAVLLLLGTYLLLQRWASLPKAPAIVPAAAQTRPRFPLDIALPDLDNRIVRLSNLRGQVILINFWATWCSPCRLEMPSMQALYQDYRNKGFEILAISNDMQGKEAVGRFVNEFGLTFHVLLDPQNVVGNRLLVRGLPMTYVIDKAGRVAGQEMGAKDWNSPKMRRLLDTLLAEQAGTDAL